MGARLLNAADRDGGRTQSPRLGFLRRDGWLHADAIPLALLAERFGTPAYVYSATAIRAQYARLHEALAGVAHRLHYSVKANGNLALLALLRDLDANQAVLVRRDTRAKQTVSLDTLGEDVAELLTTMQQDMLIAARERMEANTVRGAITYERFRELMEGQGAFVYAGWCGSAACEAEIKEETKATIRVLPDEEFRSPETPETCMVCGRAASVEAVWARAY